MRENSRRSYFWMSVYVFFDLSPYSYYNISFILLRIPKYCSHRLLDIPYVYIMYTDIVYWKWYVSSNSCSKFYKPKYTRHFSFEISVYFQSPHVATFLFRLVNLLYDPYHIAHKNQCFLLYFLYLVAIFIPGKNPSYKSSSFFFLLCINIFFKDIFWRNNLNFHHYLSKSIYMNV